MLERLTIATDSSFWPTATVGDHHGSGSHGYGKVSASTGKSRSEGVTLTDAAVRLWQTPQATDGDKGGPNQTLKGQPSLVNQARRMWQTPSVGDGDKYAVSENPNSQAAKSLHPQSLDLSGLLDPTMRSRGEESSSQGRTLNPRFVEWLMGWPIAWTDCDSQVTEWFLVKPLKL
jgi:hypothetical protein